MKRWIMTLGLLISISSAVYAYGPPVGTALEVSTVRSVKNFNFTHSGITVRLDSEHECAGESFFVESDNPSYNTMVAMVTAAITTDRPLSFTYENCGLYHSPIALSICFENCTDLTWE